MKIENIKINTKYVKEGSIFKGDVSATLNGITVYKMSIIEGKNGLFVAMPLQKDKEGKTVTYAAKDGKEIKCAYVYLTKEDSQELNDAVINAYNNLQTKQEEIEKPY